MRMLVNQLDFEVPSAVGPDLSASLVRVFPEVPERWVFGGSASSLVSNKGKQITPAATPPTYDATHVITPAVNNNGLFLPFLDSASFIEIFAFANGSYSTGVLGGTYGNDGAGVQGDSVAKVTGTSVRLLGAGSTNHDISYPAQVSTTMIVVGVSYSPTHKRGIVHGGNNVIDVAATKTVRPGAYRRLGHNGALTESYVRAVPFSDYMYLPRAAADMDELQAMVDEMAAHVAARGLTVL